MTLGEKEAKERLAHDQLDAAGRRRLWINQAVLADLADGSTIDWLRFRYLEMEVGWVIERVVEK